MKKLGTVFYHGYGVRGPIWDLIRKSLAELDRAQDEPDDTLGPTFAPSFDANDIDDLIRRAKDAAVRFSADLNAPMLLVGHSLGAVLAAVVAEEIGPPVVKGAVLIAPPYGDRERPPGALLRFLFRHRLIPPALLRPRFFSSHTPVSIQKEIFAAATPEAPALRELNLTPRFFHTDRFSSPLPVPSMVLASRCDRVVPAERSVQFGDVLGSEIVVWPEHEQVGHDDFFASPRIADRTARVIADFAMGR